MNQKNRITVRERTPTGTGQCKCDPDGKQGHRVKPADGGFAAALALRAGARPARISAVFKGGVLTVHFARNYAILLEPVRFPPLELPLFRTPSANPYAT
jgi:HSP20 family molecular chaperone IbpA